MKDQTHGEDILLSIVIPCRNEERHIGDCLTSILRNDITQDRYEVLVVDGMSEDGTRDIVGDYMRKHEAVRMIDNPGKITATALNIGIDNARGELIMRMDAHCTYAEDYVLKCVESLLESGADNVGGICIAVPSADTYEAKAIAIALAHPFGVGNARFRIGSGKVRQVDTVPFGTFRRDLFQRIGYFDEDLIRNQDDEFNLRITRNKGKILLIPDIVAHYYTRPNLKELWRQYYLYGYWKVRVIRKHALIPTIRSIVPALFVVSCLATLGLAFMPYALLNLVVSLKIARKEEDPRLLPFLFLAFTTIHLSYGIGFIKGVWDSLLKESK